MLSVRNLSASFHTRAGIVRAVRNVSFDVAPGETLGIVGESGSGKSVTCYSIMGLIPMPPGRIESGSAMLDGTDLLRCPEKELRAIRGKRISMIFQDPMTSLNPTQTVGDQILEVLNLHFPEMTREEKNKRVDEMMTLVGIPPQRKKSFPHEFSGGMKQRVVIAMALVAEPELLLADEPTTALDVTIQAQILELMKQLREKFNTSVMLITHDLGVVAQFCDSVSVVYAGRVVEYGPVEIVFQRKENHPYTAGLFNCIPNLHDDQPRLHPIAGHMADPRVEYKGCCFADRCEYATERCRTEAPSMHVCGEHGILCHRYAEKEEF